MPATEPQPYVLQDYGLTEPINIVGNAEELLPGKCIPILFLIDENHGSDPCIEQNLTNALELVQKAQVALIGVESHAGGFEWDIHEERYTQRFDMGTDPNPVSTCTKFAEKIRSAGALVLGVESRSMSEQEQGDFAPGCPWYGKQTKDHPLNRLRSEHFVRALFELRRRHKLNGNLILNAGGDHISHIVGFIKDGIIEPLAAQKAAYVRVRAATYHDK